MASQAHGAAASGRLARLAGAAGDERGRRDKIAQVLAEPVPAVPGTGPGPFLCYLTIEGLDGEPNPRRAMRLRGRINAAARAAAEHRRTTYHATDSTITIGIYGPDAAERINQLHQVVVTLGAGRGWTVRHQAR